jgi:hypothetical protein
MLHRLELLELPNAPARSTYERLPSFSDAFAGLEMVARTVFLSSIPTLSAALSCVWDTTSQDAILVDALEPV